MKRDVAEYERMARALLRGILVPDLLSAGSERLYIDHALATADFEFVVTMARAGEPHARSAVDLFTLHWKDNWGEEVPLPEPLMSYILDRGLNDLEPTKRGKASPYLYRNYLISVAAQRLSSQLPELDLMRSRDKHGSQKNPSICTLIHNFLCEVDVAMTERQVEEAVHLPLRPDDWLP